MSGAAIDPYTWIYILLLSWCVLGVYLARKASSRWGAHLMTRRIILAIGWFPILALTAAGTLFVRLWLRNGELPDRRFHMAVENEQLAYVADTSAAGFEVHDNLAVFLMFSTLLLLPLVSPLLGGLAWECKPLRRPCLLFAGSYAICLIIVIFEPSGTMDWLLNN